MSKLHVQNVEQTERERMFADYQRLGSSRKVGALYGVSHQTILCRLRRARRPVYSRGKRLSPERRYAIFKYVMQEDHTIMGAAKHFGHDRKVVRVALRWVAHMYERIHEKKRRDVLTRGRK